MEMRRGGYPRHSPRLQGAIGVQGMKQTCNSLPLPPYSGNCIHSPDTPPQIQMKPWNRHIAVVTGIAFAILLLAVGPASSQPSDQDEQAIQHLMAYVSGSDMRFVRNAREYTPPEAAAHMEKKYRHFRAGIETADDFIELCATQSLLSGKPYLVIDRQGQERHTSDWLRAELAAWQAHSQ
jgi:hypothetical protein